MIYALQTVLQIDVTNVTEQVVAAVKAFLITSLLGLFFFLLGRGFSEMKLRGHDHMLWAMWHGYCSSLTWCRHSDEAEIINELPDHILSTKR